ncbi:LysR family transcriptional regulator [Goodfellowiella coeruleoviolacea]|uniref:DNA-binding transcriptional regulator, LysR family n=1 Tax=Goodfellowiella coeruleoviolacea TaxID=334858 RepID=A0AAE3GAP2_9PSEU|nr:LysR family transcriptional regulator [Goodfellowiella coeruleoviolacea]MCP2163965.1 DNA-binding transcriptional regulator, LysR family [Goodfellowiella coeruleoviolacea]
MELRHLRYALTLAEHAHFGRAAAALGIAQPPLSQQIKNLETELGVRLFDRTGHGVHPTAAGRAFLRRAEEVLRNLDLAALEAASAGRGETGRLAIGFLGTALSGVLPEALSAFRRQYPDVHLDPREMPSTAQMEALVEGHIDAGFVCGPVPAPASARLTAIPLTRELLVAAVPADHELADRQPLDITALAGQRLILHSRQAEPAAVDAAVAMCRAAGVEPGEVLETGGLHTMLGLVACGLGIAVGPQSMRRFRRDGVRVVDLAPNPPTVNIHLAHRTDNDEQVLRNFRSVVVRTMRRPPARRPAISSRSGS